MCLGIPGKVVEIGDDAMRMSRVSFGGIVREVCLAYCPDAVTHDYVIVHAGFAISIVDPLEAQKTLGFLQQLNNGSQEDPQT